MEAIVQAGAFGRRGHDRESCDTAPLELLGGGHELAQLTATKRAIQTAEKREEYRLFLVIVHQGYDAVAIRRGQRHIGGSVARSQSGRFLAGAISYHGALHPTARA